MEVHRFNDFDPTTARYSVKFLLAGPDESYDNATLILFSSLDYQHTEVRNKLATVLGIDKPKLLTAGVFHRNSPTEPYRARIGSESLNTENVAYRYTIPDDVREMINELINGIVGTAANSD